MKKIKSLVLAVMAVAASASFTACSDDSSTESNYARYQAAVDDAVGRQKSRSGNGKVILLVAFGSTWEQAYDTFDRVVSDYKAQFAGWDVYLSFSSAICINNARAGENVAPKDYYSPEHWLTAIGKAGYRQIVVQSLQVIPGEEYRNVRDGFVKNFMNNRNGDFTEAYMHSIDRQVVIGTPLMAEEEDAEALAKVLDSESDIRAAADEGIVAFMGHGNPESKDYYGGNIRYLQLENCLRKINRNYYVGTVDMDDTHAEDVLKHILSAGAYDFTIGNNTVTIEYDAPNESAKARLYPLMSIAGDHAHNDMADEDDPESWYTLFNKAGIRTAAYQTTFKDGCWRSFTAGAPYIPALAERASVRALWMNHTREAISRLGTDDALSTPTTAVEE